MGFRNPLSSLSGDQITPGTVTGSTIQTAGSGKRVAMFAAGGAGTSGTLQFFTGSSDETQAGRADAYVDTSPGSPRGVLELLSPVLDTGGSQLRPAALYMAGSTGDGFTTPQATLDADRINLGSGGSAAVNVGSLKVGGVAYAQARSLTFQRATGSGTDTYGAGSYASLVGGTWAAAPAGDYLLVPTLTVAGSVQSVGFLQVTADGSVISSGTRADVLQTYASVQTTVHAFTHAAAGNLTVLVQHQVSTGTGTVFNASTKAVLVWLGPRS